MSEKIATNKIGTFNSELKDGAGEMLDSSNVYTFPSFEKELEHKHHHGI